jgi:hypothetical protein
MCSCHQGFDIAKTRHSTQTDAGNAKFAVFFQLRDTLSRLAIVWFVSTKHTHSIPCFILRLSEIADVTEKSTDRRT